MPLVSDVSAPGLNVAIVKRKRPAYGWSPVPGGARTIKLGRKPTPFEERVVSLADIPTRLNAEVERLTEALALSRRMAFDGVDPSSLDAVSCALAVIQEAQARVANYGAFEHRQEWCRQGHPMELRDSGFCVSPTVPHLKRTAEMRARRTCREWADNMQELRYAFGRARPGHTPSQFEAYADKWVPYGLSNVAKQVINNAFAYGRSAERTRLVSLRAQDAETYVYTAVLDANTCPSCEEKDGTEFYPDEVIGDDASLPLQTRGEGPRDESGRWASPDWINLQVPSPECHGGPDRCRCIWVAIDSEPGWVDARNEHQRMVRALKLARSHAG